jgi:pentatricopeptide repeat protein
MVQEAQSVFKHMLKAGIRPDVRSYTVLMDAYGQAGRCDEAERLLLEMEANGFVPDSVTYSVIVKAFANAERWHNGIKYYRLLQQQQQQETSNSQLFPNLIAGIESQYANFINGSERRRGEEEALQMMFNADPS